MAGWQLGDRVVVVLPDRGHPDRGGHRIPTPVTGTVVEVDAPHLPAGVRISLDRLVNGVDTCYALHREAHPA